MQFQRHAWCVAAIADKVACTPRRRVVLDGREALCRQKEGTIATVLDRGPLRAAPRNGGRLEGDVLPCLRHGPAFEAVARRRARGVTASDNAREGIRG